MTIAAADETKEVLLGAELTAEALELQVITGGCTSKSDFKIEVNKKTSPYRVTIRRLKPDLCKALFPEGTKLSFSRKEIGLDQDSVITIENSIAFHPHR